MSKERYKFNVKLVKAVKQHPCLYNFQLSEYSKRDVVSAAWEQVAQEMNESVPDCKSMWRTLRVSYTRSIKSPLTGSGAKNISSRTKDMIAEMNFIRPFVNSKNGQELPRKLKLPPQPSRNNEDNNHVIELSEADDESSCNENKNTIFVETIPDVQAPKINRRECFSDCEDVDAIVMDYIKNRRTTMENPKRMFLLSLLPDLEQMNDKQMRLFRNKVCTLVDEILIDGSYPKPTSQTSTSLNFEHC